MNTKNLLENPEIVEILGAFIGDGWIESTKDALYITGSPSEDKDYYDNHLAPLFSKHFISVKPKNFPYWGVYGVSTYRRNIIEKSIKLGFQIGPKSLVAKIPEQVMNSKDIEVIKAVIRGIFDTDGSFWCERSRAKTSTEWKRKHNYHPELRITSCSRILLLQIKTLLEKVGIESRVVQKAKKGIKNNRNINDCYALNIRKLEEIKKWFEVIGTNNLRHKSRFQVWQKLGHLPPRTTIQERLKVLKEKQ